VPLSELLQNISITSSLFTLRCVSMQTDGGNHRPIPKRSITLTQAYP